MTTKEEISSFKIPELQQRLEDRGLDTSGKKAELVERLWEAVQADQITHEVKDDVHEEATPGKVDRLVTQLRILKETDLLDDEEARVEQTRRRIKARREQLTIEQELIDLGHDVASDERVRTSQIQTKAEPAPGRPGDLSAALAEQVQRSLLPPTVLTPFSGEISEYKLFIQAFESRVASKTQDKSELMYYLEQYTQGKAREIVHSCLYLGNRGYDEARRLLEGRYGNRHLLIETFSERLRDWPRVSHGDVEGLDRLVLFLTEVQYAMSDIPRGELDHPRTLREIVRKLPIYLQDRWLREADRVMEGPSGRTVVLADLVDFLKSEVRVKGNAIFGSLRPEPRPSADATRSGSYRARVSATSVQPAGVRPSPHSSGRRCGSCGGNHFIDDCSRLRRQAWEERKKVVYGLRLCFGCLQGGHVARSCPERLKCRVCGAWHPTLLHRSRPKRPLDADRSHGAPVFSSSRAPGAPFRSEQTPFCGDQTPFRGDQTPFCGNQVPLRGDRVSFRSGQAPPGGGLSAPGVSPQSSGVGQVSPSGSRPPSGGGQSEGRTVVSAGVNLREPHRRTMMPIVPVRVRTKFGGIVETNAFLDPGSSSSIVTENLAERLGARAHPVSITVDTVAGQAQNVRSYWIDDLEVGPRRGEEFYPLPPMFTLSSLPVTEADKCQQREFDRWEHLRGIGADSLDAPVELLIGSNAPLLLVATEVRAPVDFRGPYGVKTVLGWHVFGTDGADAGADSRHLINFLRMTESACHSGDCVTTDMFRKLYEQDFQDLYDDREVLSVEEREWLAKVKSTVHKDEAGHFEIGLPKGHIGGSLPDSFPAAKRRLESLRCRLRRDPELFDAYKDVMVSLEKDGYAVRVDEEKGVSGPVWYLPHHAVRQPEKGKLRVVFDCAARSGGICLNDLLEKGPQLTNSLLGVLCRFREGRVAFTCDIQAMYHRVHLPEEDSDLLRFLWFKDGDIEGDVEVWKMRSHIFGAVSSSSVASLALQLCAEGGREQFPEAADVLLRNSYVDDVLKSVETVEQGVELVRDLRELCDSGAFNLRKFASSSAELLKQIPVADRETSLKDIDLDRDELGSERALGLKWSMRDDSFCFQFRDKGKPVTRRGILSTVNSLFDPLGIVAPVTLGGKLLLQKLCASSCGWDDALPRDLRDDWQNWVAQALELNSVSVDRCILGPSGDVTSTQLHIFVDASEKAYSAVAYVRREVRTDEESPVFVRFLMGRAHVNPIRFVSVPRLELTAAVLGVKVRKLLIRELDMKFDDVIMWSDSMFTLACIRNTTAHFKTYVANRVSYIRDGSRVSEWAYVPSKENPADMGSRGASPRDLSPWLEGPSFLSQPAEDWPSEPETAAEIPNSEMKKSCPVAATVVAETGPVPSDVLLSYFSSLNRLRRAVAWYRKFGEVLRSGEYRRFCLAKRKGLRTRSLGAKRSLTVADLECAEVAIVRFVQRSSVGFPSLDTEGPVNVRRSDPLAKLRPSVRNGVLVVGGRLGESQSISETAKYPMILPRKHHVSRLLIRRAHISVGHQGRDHTFWKLREKYWILGAGSEIRQMLRSCLTCRRVNSRPQPQLMADLPSERITSDAPAFSQVGLDVFGPIAVKSGRGEKYRYGLMCTCMVTRAVHIELLDSLRTDSLINAIRRIAARRGPVRYVVSDMGTNMVGADRELREALRGLDRDSLRHAALAEGIDWHFNPPTGSHFGGFTERQIRTFRKVWRSMPAQQRLDEETLSTLFCEIEAILNNRPLNYVSTASGNLEPLTPAHLLLLRGGVRLMPGEYSDADFFSRRRWRQVQYLAGQFWTRFKAEYLPVLQKRQKWTRASRNMTDGDIVLLVDSDVPRGQWKMGRVVKVIPSKDDLVRKVMVKTSTSTYLRPVHKLVLLQGSDLMW